MATNKTVGQVGAPPAPVGTRVIFAKCAIGAFEVEARNIEPRSNISEGENRGPHLGNLRRRQSRVAGHRHADRARPESRAAQSGCSA